MTGGLGAVGIRLSEFEGGDGRGRACGLSLVAVDVRGVLFAEVDGRGGSEQYVAASGVIPLAPEDAIYRVQGDNEAGSVGRGRCSGERGKAELAGVHGDI